MTSWPPASGRGTPGWGMARARRFDWDNLALRIVSGAILAPAALAIVWFDPFHVSFLS